MDLKSGYPWWAVRNGLIQAFPPLEKDLRCDVLVVGGGITGALIANELSRHGHDVAVIEQRDIGWGSTAASTALLQYEIDTHLLELAQRYGQDAAALAYRACAEAMPALGEVSRGLDVDFQRMDSLYLASRHRDVPRLMAEGEARRGIGLDARWLGPEALQERFDVDAGGALLTRQAARVDPYRLTYALLQRVRRRGGNVVHDRTVLHTLTPSARGVSALTEGGATIHARHVVLAMGYANQTWLHQHVARNRSSYAFITDPIDADVLGRLRNTMVWESARPYLYLRATGDRRLLVGGLDDAIDIPARRDRRVERKADKLMKQLLHWFPRLDPVPAFSWAGTFAETADGLPFFGPHDQWGPRVHFAMAYGGNGITYSMIGAQLLRARIERRKHPLQGLFGFGRL
ncbi:MULTISPECIES: NAD(P)/FAD-dependent oxidoreductase [Stenotrophomonas]|uniref:FAD dependent oxidoreductase n=1 Tax=Stenotrophomonas maltophilia (strain R551-3) TaxID=391008 RepID=B4SM15_STRM5|nr:FAD-dependent oxidoreductase [Stenotrophomonas maltophilia]ACF53460.1 FAD dependent oxidoreductase [Stenotrophomonas maltophilia R551-3]BBO53437.1 oxidoreductase [Stenotrophomonas maltophilia]